jgi:hypothetical protein
VNDTLQFDQLNDRVPESVWHDPSFVSKRERARNMRVARKRQGALENEEEFSSPEREADLVIERPALQRQKRNRKPGDPSRAVPLAFDEHGDFMEPLRGRVPEKQAIQSRLLREKGLAGKARRQAWCGLIGRRRDCYSANPLHVFYTPSFCGNRYCTTCGPKSFRRLFAQHSRLRPLAESLLTHRPEDHRPRVLAKLDITTRNVGAMPSAKEVRQFNKDIRRLFRAIETEFGISRREYGVLWCCEFGSGNTNLHAHGVYAGPFIPQRQLSRIWQSIRSDGSFIVSIKRAHSFEAALGHALKYPSKFFNAAPERLVQLEVAFDRVRRVHALAAFYNPKIQGEAGKDAPVPTSRCPICGDPLLDAQGYHFISDMKLEGRRAVDTVRVEMNRARVLGESPP